MNFTKVKDQDCRIFGSPRKRNPKEKQTCPHFLEFMGRAPGWADEAPGTSFPEHGEI